MRHDVDARPDHSLHFARLQHELGITGTYYFRAVPGSWDEGIIREIASLGHEIGYHYEDMDFANGDPHKAINLFEHHLEKLRNIADVQTICMHGSPLSKYDNKEVWNHYSYRDYGILAEPYFDLDFSEVFYITDTGRRWDGGRYSIRDRATYRNFNEPRWPSYHTTQQIIEAVENGSFPDKVMMNFHPQRWTNNPLLWTRELVAQNVKNVAKALLKTVRRG